MTDKTLSSTPDLRSAPLPTARTLRMRRNLPYQAYRFAAFNLRIVRMVLKGHH
ncbi:hypothetical protein G7075_01555 [Phycicoccus sp. HDW14]|uniref:hypothetical protein n=1 Tax=Phycicoccus sp. HDW14 TaxID=2714941 RepID=UPI00140ABEA7|nr:hypothetical protein [Phycicoccus sp. HDW14]QIM20132.1 hypothetical protein G7075_01555 [Phycicoccus sp. HDW14]